MRQLGVGIKNTDLAKIEPSANDQAKGIALNGYTIAATGQSTGTNTPQDFDRPFSKSQAGRILLQVENSGEAWYVNPSDLKRYYLGRPSDAIRIMRELSLGISRENLALIHKDGVDESIDQYSKYEHKKIATTGGEFTIDLVEIDLKNPNLKIISASADPETCKSGCHAKSLGRFISENEGFAGINGSYFCDSGNCGKDPHNYYFYPVYNQKTGKLINEEQLKYWTTGPIIAFDVNNKFYYFKDSREFKSVASFEKTYGVKLQAAIGNKPRLIQDYMNYLIEWELDQKQMTSKSTKMAVGYKDQKLYLVAAYRATIPDLANVMQALGVEFALNLDGGGSTALFYNDEYMVGPGRDVPNAIVFSLK